MTSIYFHGFNSAPNPDSPKIQELEKLGDVKFVEYDTFATFDEVFKSIDDQLTTIIKDSQSLDFLLVGTSLGGFWAATMSSHTGLAAVLINPSTEPFQSMEKYVGEEFENYVTGVSNRFKAHIPSTYRHMPKTGKFIILMDEGDEVFDYKEVDKYFNSHVAMLTFEGGSHRFEHMEESLPHIEKFYNHIQTTI